MDEGGWTWEKEGGEDDQGKKGEGGKGGGGGRRGGGGRGGGRWEDMRGKREKHMEREERQN